MPVTHCLVVGTPIVGIILAIIMIPLDAQWVTWLSGVSLYSDELACDLPA